MSKRKKTNSYPEEYRREAGRTATEVAEELDIHVGQIYNWRAQFN
jgi:transposase-like protein